MKIKWPEVIKWLKENSPSESRPYLVFLDNNMTFVNGPDTIKWLRKRYGSSVLIYGITDDENGMDGAEECFSKNSFAVRFGGILEKLIGVEE